MRKPTRNLEREKEALDWANEKENYLTPFLLNAVNLAIKNQKGRGPLGRSSREYQPNM